MSAHDQADPRVLDADETDRRRVRPGGRDARLLTGLYRLGWASMLANGLLIVTGGLVRLTGSGLGCPTWPRCTDSSWTNTPEMGIHGYIEFGNRTLTFVLTAIAVATFVWGWRLRKQYPRLFALTVALLAGIPLQAVIGGITVWVQLSPYMVMIHLLLSVALVSICTWIVHLVWRRRVHVVDPTSVLLTRVAYVLTWAVIYLGTLVTGSGPHAGDLSSPRTGLDLEMIAKAHAWSVWALVALTIYLVAKLRIRSAYALLAVLVLQGIVGYVQYFTGLPRGLIILHLLGVCLVTIAATDLALSVRRPTELHPAERSSHEVAA